MVGAYIKYPENYQDVMPLTCSTSLAGASCLIFPKQRTVVVYAEPGVSTGALSVQGMTNGIYIQPNDKIEIKVGSLSNVNKYQLTHPVLVERDYQPLAGGAVNMFDIINTQNSGNIFLRNYWNTVKMEIYGLFTSPFVKAFYITTPPEVTDWDPHYCNATI